MTLRISGKHMNVGESLETRIQTRMADAIEKYFGHGFSGHVTIEKQSAFFVCDCFIHLDSGVILQASARETDPSVSFDRAAERIEKRLRRYKRKLKDHHHNAQGDPAADAAVAYAVMSTPDDDEEVAEDFAPAVVAESSTTVKTQTVAMAVMQLELMDQPVNVFRNAANGSVNVVYRRTDGNIGWVDPSRPQEV
ncbi:MAG: ribosome-associated translation inhibitor RaiA [Pseudomonadota bacterium]